MCKGPGVDSIVIKKKKKIGLAREGRARTLSIVGC